jgi:parallel beta-helix repeat protein
MSGKKALLLLLLVSVVLVAFFQIEVVKADPTTIVVPDDYSAIQAAVYAAREGDVVFVKSGTYNESVLINKPISLVGEDLSTTKIVGDWSLNGTIVLIRHNNVTVTGFTIQPEYPSDSRRGVHLLHANYCNIFGNIFLNNSRGIWLYESSENNITDNTINSPDNLGCGIDLDYSPNNWICENIVEDNNCGIAISSSQGNTICNNTIINNHSTGLSITSDGNNITNNVVRNQECGISLSGSNNILRDNEMSNNTSNFCFGWGISWDASKFVNDVDTSNHAEGKPIIYWINEQDRKVPENAAFVALINCSNIIVENLTLSKVGQGIIVVSTVKSDITQNLIQVSDGGVLVHSSFGITITDNKIIDGGTGVHLVSSSENTINDNTLIDGGTGIALVFSSENTITSNTITKRVRGIQLDSSNENIISNNIISGGSFGGINLDGSKRNSISSNEISDCRQLALMFWNNASENLFYLNNFIANGRNVEDYYPGLPEFPINIWDNGTVGNFWSDYYGTDNNGDGVGDTPYIINEDNQDNHPLMKKTIIPEFPLWTPLLIMVVAVMMVAVVYRRKLRNQEKLNT